jgi:hypothetical protein
MGSYLNLSYDTIKYKMPPLRHNAMFQMLSRFMWVMAFIFLEINILFIFYYIIVVLGYIVTFTKFLQDVFLKFTPSIILLYPSHS